MAGGDDSNLLPPNADGEKNHQTNGYYDEAAMIDAANRAVSEGLKALNDDYIVTPDELGAYGDPDDPVSKDGIKLALHVAICAGGNVHHMYIKIGKKYDQLSFTIILLLLLVLIFRNCS
jgi:hypothetical protein